MSRMTKPVELAPRRTAHEALDNPTLTTAMAVSAVAEEMKHLRQDMETRWRALETHVNDALGVMDGSVTGLHQDAANLILRVQTLTRWLAARFPEFPAEAETTLTQLIADMNAEAAKRAAEEEMPDAEQSAETVPVQAE